MRLLEHLKDPVHSAILVLGRILPDTVAGDRLFLRLLYRNRLHKKLNLDHPRAYNEKLQWMKIYDRDPSYTMMVDKYAVKEYVAGILGEEYIIPTLGVWERFEDIDFDALPNQFVLKCTHDSGGLVICTDKSKFDKAAAAEKINHSLRRKYYKNTREWPYKNVKPRIIAEKYMVDESGVELKDYKYFVFNGRVEAMMTATERMTREEPYVDFFDRDFQFLPFTNGQPNSPCPMSKPESFEQMIAVSEKLGAGMPHVRVDLYCIMGKIYFGEMTFFSDSGLSPFVPEEWDYKFGSWLKLPGER